MAGAIVPAIGFPALRARIEPRGVGLGREIAPRELGRWPRLHHVAHHHLALGGRALVEFRIHPARDTFAGERLLELLADRRILLVIRDGAAALAEVDGAVIHQLLARPAGLARTLIVGPVPSGDAQPVLADAEMLME